MRLGTADRAARRIAAVVARHRAIAGFSDALMAEGGRFPKRSGMTIRALRMPGSRNVAGFSRCPGISSRTDGMTCRTTDGPRVTHGGGCP